MALFFPFLASSLWMTRYVRVRMDGIGNDTPNLGAFFFSFFRGTLFAFPYYYLPLFSPGMYLRLLVHDEYGRYMHLQLFVK